MPRFRYRFKPCLAPKYKRFVHLECLPNLPAATYAHDVVKFTDWCVAAEGADHEMLSAAYSAWISKDPVSGPENPGGPSASSAGPSSGPAAHS